MTGGPAGSTAGRPTFVSLLFGRRVLEIFAIPCRAATGGPLGLLPASRAGFVLFAAPAGIRPDYSGNSSVLRGGLFVDRNLLLYD